MVTPRGSTSFADLQKAKSKEYFVKFGRSDISLLVKTTTLNQAGRPVTVTTATTTNLIGDLQFDAKLISEYVQMGIAKTGDGVFYTLPSYTIAENYEIVVDSITWRLVKQVEGEQTNGVTIYQGWVCRRNP
jgi:hypothetical protein